MCKGVVGINGEALRAELGHARRTLLHVHDVGADHLGRRALDLHEEVAQVAHRPALARRGHVGPFGRRRLWVGRLLARRVWLPALDSLSSALLRATSASSGLITCASADHRTLS